MGKYYLIFIGIFYLIASTDIFAQYQFAPNKPRVISGEKELRMPWAGGLNSVQYNSLDLNSDGTNDLVLFDRSANKLTTYLLEAGQFQYTPEFEIYFPKDLVSWVLIRDFDCDGLNDLFTDSQQGMRVFRNLGTNPISWELVLDPVPTLGSQLINLFFNASDISAIDDLDGDGDLDVLAYNFATGETIDYHQNMSMENTGSCGLDFVRITRNYGGISECGCGDFNFAEPCPVNGRILHSGGKAILPIDLDNDGDKEIFIGEETCNELTLLTNKGNPSNALFDDFTDFFSNTAPNDQLYFPAAYYIDLDANGVKDLAISSNLRERINDQTDFSQSSYFYRNTSQTDIPEFELVSNNFLQNEMIDVGEYAYPAFADYDNDSDQDLFIGNKGHNGSNSRLFLYKNTGSPNQPMFDLITDDFSQLSNLNLIDLKPQFLDLNRDNHLDLVVVGQNSSTGVHEMLLILNNSKSEFQFNTLDVKLMSDLPALSDHPTLSDINQDGEVDLLVGRITGRLEYYENFNTSQEPDFQLVNQNFLDIQVSIERINLVPFVFDLNRDGQEDLITTDGSGELSIYSDFLNNEDGPARAVFRNSFEEELQTSQFGRVSWPTVTDIYNTGSVDLAIGTIPGGVFLLNDTSLVVGPQEELGIEIFPNPSSGRNVFIRSGVDGTAQVFNISGKLISSEISLMANQPFLLESTLYPNGVYVIRFVSNTGSKASGRVIISN